MTTEETELRELDAWIGEHIMGLTPGKSWRPEYVHCSLSLPRYSTNPADAMAVLERCLHAGADVLIMSFENEDGGKSYSVCESGDKTGECFPTLPLAICQFAKKLFEK